MLQAILFTQIGAKAEGCFLTAQGDVLDLHSEPTHASHATWFPTKYDLQHAAQVLQVESAEHTFGTAHSLATHWSQTACGVKYDLQQALHTLQCDGSHEFVAGEGEISGNSPLHLSDRGCTARQRAWATSVALAWSEWSCFL